MGNGQAVPVLLVEDDLEDIEITKRALKKGGIANPFYAVRDGKEAMEFDRFLQAVVTIGQYWLCVAVVPDTPSEFDP